MSENANLELLNLIHAVTTASTDTQKALALAIARSSNGSVTVPLEGALAIQTVMSLQSRIIAGLTEQNQEIVDRVEALVARIEKS